MPRKRRHYLAGIPAHVIQRGNNRQPCFFTEQHYRLYLEWLGDAALHYGCEIHAYVLMTNHVHLLLTPQCNYAISKVLQSVCRRYVRYLNDRYGRTGTLWEGRHKGSLVQSERYFLACSRYIELNPVRAGMVNRPADYPWSSYRHNAQGEINPLLSGHPQYLQLGSTSTARASAYRRLFRDELDACMVDEIRRGATLGVPTGTGRFTGQIEHLLGYRVRPGKPGRPRRKSVNTK